MYNTLKSGKEAHSALAEALLSDPNTWAFTPQIHWELVLRFVERYHLGPLVYFRTRQNDLFRASVPVNVLQKYREQYAASIIRVSQQDMVIRSLTTLFEDLPAYSWRFVKSARWRSELYADPAIRPATDIDLFCKSETLEEIKHKLTSKGWEYIPPIASPTHVRLRDPDTGTVLEVHFTLGSPLASIEQYAPLGRSIHHTESRMLTSRSRFCPADFVFALFHLAKHGLYSASPLHLLDLVQAVQFVGKNPEFWKEAEELIIQDKCVVICLSTFALLKDIAPELIFPELRSLHADKYSRLAKHSGKLIQNWPIRQRFRNDQAGKLFRLQTGLALDDLPPVRNLLTHNARNAIWSRMKHRLTDL
jgi:hypothetical protein